MHRLQPRPLARPVWAPPLSLATTRGILSFPRVNEMFQFTRFPPCCQGLPACPGRGFPIRISLTLAPAHGSSELFAVYHVLHRHLTPRHPPCALLCFTALIRRRGSSRAATCARAWVGCLSRLALLSSCFVYVVVKLLRSFPRRPLASSSRLRSLATGSLVSFRPLSTKQPGVSRAVILHLVCATDVLCYAFSLNVNE
jgi:hypothetical protein